MNNNYIQDASAFLDSLVEQMNIELFIEQYQKLDHDLLRHSIPLDDERLSNYYLCYLKHSKRIEGNSSKNIWNSLINKNVEFPNQIFGQELDVNRKKIIPRTHYSSANNFASLDRVLNKFTYEKNLKVIVDKEKYETSDFQPSLAA